MKKTFSIGISLLVIGSFLFYFVLYPRLPLISGFSAKILCSCVFVSGLSEAEARGADLNFGPVNQATNEINYDSKTAVASIFGFHQKRAVYRDGVGCSLVNEELKPFNRSEKTQKFGPEIWPSTNLKTNPRLQKIIEGAFDLEGESKLNTRAVIIIQNGEIVGEAYGKGIGMDTRLPGWSLAKSVTGLLAGILEKDGYWKLDDALPIEEWKVDDRKDITLRNVMNMTTGLKWKEDYASVSPATIMLYSRDNMGAHAASYPLEYPTGTHWEYSSGTTNILSWSMAQAFENHSKYLDFPYQRLFGPIGAQSFVFETDASGHYVGSSYAYGTARDWAKIGLLFLNRGNWRGDQIVDSTWVEFCRTPVSESKGIYGGQIWFPHAQGKEGYRPTDYAMDGFQGQSVSIHPEDDMIIVRLGVMYEEEDFDFGAWVKEVREALK